MMLVCPVEQFRSPLAVAIVGRRPIMSCVSSIQVGAAVNRVVTVSLTSDSLSLAPNLNGIDEVGHHAQAASPPVNLEGCRDLEQGNDHVAVMHRHVVDTPQQGIDSASVNRFQKMEEVFT
jgi:hypothetical protein